MNRFIRELRRREVFSTAGLYVGISWILIEAASVILPTFDAPEWIMRAIIIVAVVGFPVMLVLAWVYDLTEYGLKVTADPTDTIVPPIGGRKMDFAVIGVLTVALILSVYLNITSGPAVIEEPDPVSILIADFGNETGNPLFDGLLEQALTIGIESAPHITSYQRNSALGLATRLQPGVKALDAAAARLVAVREGINLVFAGSISPDGSGFELAMEAVDPATGEAVFDVSSDAKSPDAVLTAVGQLSEAIREELGDITLGKGEDATAETFTAASLEAAQAYTMAIQLAYEGKHDEAVLLYQKATELDPNFGRAFSGWALSEFKRGRTEEATELWDKALSLMETMTERERLRTLGLYYASVTRNYENAVQSFSELVEKYPADAAAHNNLAVSAFLTLDFQTASEGGRRLMEIYPSSQLYRSNYTLFAMYSGEFEEATVEAQKMIDDDPDYGVPYLPLAIAAIDSGNLEAARQAYERMMQSTTGTYRESLAYLGLADVAAYSGDFSTARGHLRTGIAKDESDGDNRGAATKYIALADMFVAEGNNSGAEEAINNGLELASGDSQRVPAALLYLQMDNVAPAQAIADELSQKLQSQSRAYGLMISGMIHRQAGRYVDAIDALRPAIELADLWLIRLELGRAYLEAGYFAEALSEFQICSDRRGEATALFLDDMPTYRYLATLPYWTARAEQALGMQTSSIQGYETFLSLRPHGGPLADDARARLP